MAHILKVALIKLARTLLLMPPQLAQYAELNAGHIVLAQSLVHDGLEASADYRKAQAERHFLLLHIITRFIR